MLVPEELRPGDILLYSPSDWMGMLIAIKTWTMLSHVEVYAGRGMCFAARPQGVDLYRERIDKYLRFVRRPVMNGKSFDLQTALDTMRPTMGQPYEICGLFSFYLPWMHRHRATRVCSPQATAFLRAGGCEIFNPDLDADDVSPAQFWQTPHATTVWSRDKEFAPACGGAT